MSCKECLADEMANYRAKKSGIALRIQKKLEERYDEEDSLGTPQRTMEWMNATLQGKHPPCSGSRVRHYQFFLRDGIALCKFINILLEANGMDPVKFKMNALTPFIAMENIDTFGQGVVRYGVPQDAVFNSIDLYEGHKGPFLNVVNCLNKLGFVANSKGFTPIYESVEAPPRDAEVWANT